VIELDTSPQEEADAPLGIVTGVFSSALATIWPDPTPEMLETQEFESVWQCIKAWDIGVPNVYAGHMGATGNHVRAILDALGYTFRVPEPETAGQHLIGS
jgi:hypothetical protein